MDPRAAAAAGQEDGHHPEDASSSADLRTDAGTSRKRARRSESTHQSFESSRESTRSVSYWGYDPLTAREELAKFVVSEDLPIRLGETRGFQSMVQRGFCSQYEQVSRGTTRADILANYHEQAAELKDNFSKLSFSFALTSDVWSTSFHNVDYLGIAAHYLDDNYTLNKRVLGFKLIGGVRTGEVIAQHILDVVKDYKLENRIAAITLDNSLVTTNAMEILAPVLESHFGGYVLYQRCICDVISSIVRAGMAEMATPLGNIRSAIVYVSSSTVHSANFGNHCRAQGKKARRFTPDSKLRWDSTYIMLKEVLPYKDLLTSFVNGCMNCEFLSDKDWSLAERFHEFLEVFYECTELLSSVYRHTSPLALLKICDIAKTFEFHRVDPDFCNIAKAMEHHFLKHLETIPHLYCFAFILDPRIKFDGLQNTLSLLDEALNTSYSSTYSWIADEFSRIFCLYDAKFGSTYRERLKPPSMFSRDCAARCKKMYMWARIFPSSTSHGPPTPQTMAKGELDRYLSKDHRGSLEFADHDNADLLLFWKNHQQLYPVLSQLAREILSVPVSTVSSEAAFSIEGRAVQDRRSGLAPEMVEAMACLKDWENAAAREQHIVVDAEFASELAELNPNSE